MPSADQELRRLVFGALARAAENGYQLDPDDRQEAIDLMDTDSAVEVYCWATPSLDQALDRVTELVREYRAGARE